jgi:hypothetical protein
LRRIHLGVGVGSAPSVVASPPLTHPIISAGSPGMRKRWECRCLTPWLDDRSDDVGSSGGCNT